MAPGTGILLKVVALMFLAQFALAGATPQQRVLVLSSFAASDPVMEPVVRGLREVVSSRHGLELDVEYLDAEHDPDGSHLAEVSEYLSRKYGETNIDAIVALGEPALDFALDARGVSFNSVPVLFGEVHSLSQGEAELIPDLTGILGGFDLFPTFQLMASLHPQRRNVFVVNDGSTRSIWLRDSLSAARMRLASQFAFRESTGMSLAEIEDTLRGLGDEDIVFYVSLTEDAKGERFDFLGALLHVSHTSNVPVYGGLESMAGLGVVGGYMLDARELGAQLGDMLSQILEGTPIGSIPLVAGSPHRYVFDFRQLARFEISHRDLPSHSQIIDEPDTFYYHYRNYFWAAAAVFCALLAYIAVLLSGIAKREKARRGLERLIDERDVLLSIDTPNKLLEQLRDRLLRVVPQLSEVSFLVSTGNPEAPFAPVVVQSGTAASAAPGPDLINLAQSSQVNTFARREALLHLSSPDVPADVVYCRSRRTLDPVDQRILDILARNLDIECENQKAIRVTSSLETARQIQEAMLPTNFSEVGETLGIDLFALIRPATEVGGDLYDFYQLDEHRICIAVGDVSGKGVPAAMFMAMTRTLIRAAIEAGQNPLDAVAQANASLAAENPQMMFVTLFFGLYDRRTGRLDCVNAGHNPPLIIGHDGSIRELAVKPNVALGLIEAAEFEAQSFDISNDDTLFLYTDGVTEAQNEDGEFYRDTRLESVLRANNVSGARALATSVIESIDRFAGSAPQFDDITILVLSRG